MQKKKVLVKNSGEQNNNKATHNFSFWIKFGGLKLPTLLETYFLKTHYLSFVVYNHNNLVLKKDF